MGKFFSRMGYKFASFMTGRHGDDRLNRFLYILSCILLVISMFGLRVLLIPAMLLLGWSWFRFISRNEYARQKELRLYLKIKGKFTGWFKLQKNKWRDRKTHVYCRCPGCHAAVRLKKPPKHMTVTVRCPACGKPFDKKL